jgi:hypothetical protein
MMIPNWMPTENDSIPIWKRMFGDWMKTQEFADLDGADAGMANEVWSAIEKQESRRLSARRPRSKPKRCSSATRTPRAPD